MVGNLKKITVFFKFPTVFLRKKKEKVRVGEGKKLPSPKIILASLYVGFKVTILVMYSLRYLCVNA